MCPKYAAFDSTLSLAPVTGWYDTDELTYATLPQAPDMLELTPTQWADRLANPTNWAVSNGQDLVLYTPPVSIQVQAQMLLQASLANGITITSASLPSVDGIYALDSVSTAQIFQIGTFAKAFDFFPNGVVHQPYPDINGQMHMFTVAVFISFLQAVAMLVSDLQTQAGIMTNGGTPQWPSQTVNIA